MGDFFMEEKILLLSCCAPCCCAVVEKMAKENTNFAVAFYNPNIRPYLEYQKRLEENRKLCENFGVEFVEFEYDNQYWCDSISGLENEPERGKRCSVCFYIRLKKVMEYAKANGYSSVASVLGVSRYKNLSQVNEMADKASKEVGVDYVHIEARKDGMQERRNILIKELGLYSQDYCGCNPR